MRLGSDPEVFLVKKDTNVFTSVIGRIGANKWNPKQIVGLPDGFTLQEDNVALEFGIPPASSADEFVAHIRKVMEEGLSTLPGLAFSNLSCTIFPEEEMQLPEAHMFGCEPDFNAWTGEQNDKPKPPHPFMRSAGGHVHIETQLDPRNVVRACDLFLSVPAVLMDRGTERKKLYGKAGAYRPKPYGVEYRSLSNFWIFEENLIRWVWNNTGKALRAASLPGVWPLTEDHYLAKDIVRCINTNDRYIAKHLIKEFNVPCL
jgi:hypothetical protein